MQTEEHRGLYTGERIRLLRGRAGASMTDLAELAGISERQLSRYEKGAKVPHNVLLVLADLLGTSTDYLTCRIDDPRDPWGHLRASRPTLASLLQVA